MTTSWSSSGSVDLYCIVPICGSTLGSTVMVRLVPMASGLPGQAGVWAASLGCSGAAVCGDAGAAASGFAGAAARGTAGAACGAAGAVTCDCGCEGSCGCD